MNSPYLASQGHYPRRQAEQLVRIISQEGLCFHGSLVGKRRQGKTDLLRQVQAALFEKAEGAIPFFYSFPAGADDPASARHFFAAFCQQTRAFLMRQEELLWEPVDSLERELERAGLPLSITELARSFLALPSAQQLPFISTLPEQFAHREGRPLCLLWDDVQSLRPDSPFFSALDSPHLCWLLAGRLPFLSRIAGKGAWPLVALEPFSREDALELAGKNCLAAGLDFAHTVWELWCGIVGTSPWLIGSLVQAAALQQQRLDSIEELGRLYIRELSSGTLGNWLARRFEEALPDRRDRAIASQFLAGLTKSGASAAASALTPEVWDGLIAQEWAEEAAPGPRILLDMLERDWLLLVTAQASSSSERAQSRMFQTFVLRAEHAREQLGMSRFSTVVRQKLLDLPQSGFPAVFISEGQEIHPPALYSVSAETTATAELFWCYGFQGEKREFPVVLLIAVCDESPSEEQLQSWRRQVETEGLLLPSEVAGSPSARQALRKRWEFWVVVPPGASLDCVATERRFSWETFFRLLAQAGSAGKSLESFRQP